jgi:RNA polymerase sigma-70 factor (ECF subfamily)
VRDLNKKEFEEIYNLYAQKLYKFTLKLCGNEHDAMDIIQTTFLKAVNNISKFRGECEMSTWLCRIARNEYLDMLKKSENKNLPIETAENQSDDLYIEDIYSERDRVLRIHKALHHLDEPFREVFTMRVFGELKFSEIGLIFVKSENWARVTYFRAREKMQNIIKENE